MELPNRKQNRLEDYDYSQNGAYFITICTRDRKKFLSQIVGDDAHICPKNRIATIVRSIKVLTTKDLGESIFQRSYYDHVIRNQQDYNEIWEYIDNNPRKWLLTQENGDQYQKVL